jgi:hypothetical protein
MQGPKSIVASVKVSPETTENRFTDAAQLDAHLKELAGRKVSALVELCGDLSVLAPGIAKLGLKTDGIARTSICLKS